MCEGYRVFRCTQLCDSTQPCEIKVYGDDVSAPDYCPYMGCDCVFSEVE